MRYIQLFKASTHTVLSTYTGSSHCFLSFKRTKQCRSRVAPSFVTYSTSKKFLKRKPCGVRLASHTGNFCKRRKNCGLSSMPWTPFSNSWVKTECHQTYSRCFPWRNNWNFCSHTSFWSCLIASAIRKQYSRRTYRAVKTLTKPTLRTTCTGQKSDDNDVKNK